MKTLAIYEEYMLSDSQIYPISTDNLIKINPAVSKTLGWKHRDMRIT